MKTISPWFRTARLINGIRKAYSEGDALRSDHAPFRGGLTSKRRTTAIGSEKSAAAES